MDEEEKVSGRRRGRDLQIVERSFRWWDTHWQVIQLRTRILLVVLSAIHMYTFQQLCRGFYSHDFNFTSIGSALVSSALLAWFFYSGRCSNLNGLADYRSQRSRALARLSLAFETRPERTPNSEDDNNKWGGAGTWEDRKVTRNRWGRLTRCNYTNVTRSIMEATKLRAMINVQKIGGVNNFVSNGVSRS